jgi:hypothetical protein
VEEVAEAEGGNIRATDSDLKPDAGRIGIWQALSRSVALRYPRRQKPQGWNIAIYPNLKLQTMVVYCCEGSCFAAAKIFIGTSAVALAELVLPGPWLYNHPSRARLSMLFGSHS